jgi:hypothetical protein
MKFLHHHQYFPVTIGCGNLPQSYRRRDSFHHSRTDKQTPWSTDSAWRAQAVFIHCSSSLGRLNFNTGANQPASATSAPPPIGSHSAQRKWNKNTGLSRPSQSLNIHDSALNERASHQFISSTTTSRASRSAVPSAAPPSAGVHHGSSPHWRGQQLYAP